jgi:hypothetical protein
MGGSGQVSDDPDSSRIKMSIDGGAPGLDGYSATGAIDYAHHRGDIVLTRKGGGSDGEIQALMVGHDAYLGMNLLGQKRWKKEPKIDFSGPERFIPDSFGPSPDQLLELLTKSSKKVETVGTETIRGTPTKHYRAHLDKAKLGERGSDLPDDLVVDAWADENSLVRRIRVPLGEKDAPAYTVDLYDFGVDVNVKPPPDDEIVSEKEFSELLDRECARAHRDEPSAVSFFCVDLIAEGGASGWQSAPEPGPTVTVPTTTERK